MILKADLLQVVCQRLTLPLDEAQLSRQKVEMRANFYSGRTTAQSQLGTPAEGIDQKDAQTERRKCGSGYECRRRAATLKTARLW
ncbi:MAG: hypothetical protein AAEJ52_12250 [Myxococcota bacterium]